MPTKTGKLNIAGTPKPKEERVQFHEFKRGEINDNGKRIYSRFGGRIIAANEDDLGKRRLTRAFAKQGGFEGNEQEMEYAWGSLGAIGRGVDTQDKEVNRGGIGAFGARGFQQGGIVPYYAGQGILEVPGRYGRQNKLCGLNGIQS